ncbi:MAG: DUF5688 family protein [Herbinix sp.]|nr:DUF5688 family protein [Herbinix sp.]
MDYIKFCEQTKTTVQEILGDEFSADLVNVNKLNGIVLKSLTIYKKNQTSIPNIYLESYFKDYQEGKTIDLIAQDIITFYYQCNNRKDLSCDYVMNFTLVEDKVVYKLINYDKNKKLLEKMPHFKWMDLAIIFLVIVQKDEECTGTIMVNDDIFQKWDININALYEHAKRNTFLLYGCNIRTMEKVLKSLIKNSFSTNIGSDTSDLDTMMEILYSENVSLSNNESKMYVLTNKIGINGATCLLYKDELNNFSKKIGSSFYILPSSIHELILVPSIKPIPKEELLKMVKEVNETEVPKEEILSDNVYYYDSDICQLYSLFQEE